MLKVITVATSERFYMKWLKESCIRHGTNLVVLGDGKTWDNYLTKFKLVIDFLETEDDNNIICFVDAYDVIMTDNADKLKQAFLDFKESRKEKVIIAMNPEISFLDKKVPILSNLYKELSDIDFGVQGMGINSGTYIGYAKDIKHILKEIMKDVNSEDTDDQLFFNKYNFKNPGSCYIDINKDWFHVTSEILDLEDYGSKSFFLHRPGCSSLVNYLRKNGYTISVEEERKILNESMMEFIKKGEYHTIATLKNLLK